MKHALFLLLFLLVALPVFSQNHLQSVISAMAPGTFALLSEAGDGTGYEYSSGATLGGSFGGSSCVPSGGGMFAFSSKGVYDATTDAVYFSAAPHITSGVCRNTTIKYNIATNTWTNLGVDAAPSTTGHSYDSNVFYPTFGELYVHAQLPPTGLRRLALPSTWSVPTQPLASYPTEPSMEYFPDRDELLWFQGGWLGLLEKYNHGSNSWTGIYAGGGTYNPSATTNLGALQLRGAMLRYIPSQHFVLIFGGVDTDPNYASPAANGIRSGAMYRYKSDGSLQRVNNMPSSIWVHPNRAIAAVDPTTSHMIVMNAIVSTCCENGFESYGSDVQLWDYDPAADTWLQLPSSIVPTLSVWFPQSGVNNTSVFSIITVSVPTYGVTLWMSATNVSDSRVYVYKSAATPTSTFAGKCAQPGVLGCYGFDSSTNVRNFTPYPAPYPLKYGGWGGAPPCSTAGLGTEYNFTRGRNSGVPAGSAELNAKPEVQNGICVFPSIDTTVSSTGAGSLKITVPSGSTQDTGGYFDSTFAGLDVQPHVYAHGPDSGGEVWIQYKERMQNMANNNWNGAFPDSFIKSLLFGSVPPGDDFFGSGFDLMNVFLWAAGWSGNRNSQWESYTRDANGFVSVSERTIGGIVYLQSGARCPYNGVNPGGGYSYPPCLGAADGVWQEITRQEKLQPVASNFTVSGTTLSRASTFTSAMVGRQIFITGDNYYRITAFQNNGAVTLNAAPVAGSNKTVYISAYPNSILKEWVNGVIMTDNADQIMRWDATPVGWGEFRLQPHMTNKTAGIAAAVGTVWYDDVIISTQPIAFGTQVTPPPAGCDYFASPTGSGNGLSDTTPFQIASFWSVSPIQGKTLCLLNGTYTSNTSMIAPTVGLNGTASARITVKALNDGAVTIDGQFARNPINVNNNSFFTFQGFDVRNSAGSAFVMQNLSSNNIVQRVCAYNANPNGNFHVWSIDNGGTNLFEDVCGFGTGRTFFTQFDSSNNIFRRLWGEFESTQSTQYKATAQMNYESNFTTVENSIFTWHPVAGTNTDQIGGGFILGSGPWTRVDRRIFFNVRNSIVYVPQGFAYGSQGLGPEFYYSTPRVDEVHIDNLAVFVPSDENFSAPAWFGNCKLDDNTSTNCSAPTNLTASNVSLVGNQSSQIESQWSLMNVKQATTLTGIYGSESLWANSGNKGATICDSSMFPWPMNQRIINAMTAAGETPVNINTTMANIFGNIPTTCGTPPPPVSVKHRRAVTPFSIGRTGSR